MQTTDDLTPAAIRARAEEAARMRGCPDLAPQIERVLTDIAARQHPEAFWAARQARPEPAPVRERAPDPRRAALEAFDPARWELEARLDLANRVAFARL